MPGTDWSVAKTVARRITQDLDTDETVEDHRGYQDREESKVPRRLPDEVTNIRTVFFEPTERVTREEPSVKWEEMQPPARDKVIAAFENGRSNGDIHLYELEGLPLPPETREDTGLMDGSPWELDLARFR